MGTRYRAVRQLKVGDEEIVRPREILKSAQVKKLKNIDQLVALGFVSKEEFEDAPKSEASESESKSKKSKKESDGAGS